MAKDPAFPFYASDFLTDTLRWSREMKSLHVDLLAESWLNGGLEINRGSTVVQPNTQPNDNQDYPEGLTEADQQIWQRIKHKWFLEGGMWFNSKLEEVRESRKKFLKRQSDKGKASAEARKSNPKPAKEKVNRGSTAVQPNESEIEKEDEIELGSRSGKRGAGGKGFKPPDADQVAEYMAEINYPGLVQEEADSFVNHYTGNGWMRGKNKVKDWQAVVRTWKKRKNEEHGNQQTRVKAGAKGQHDAATVAESIKRNFDPLYQSANAG